MKCGKLLIKVNNDPFYSEDEMWMLLSSAVGLCGTLYSLDYHAFKHGIRIEDTLDNYHFIEIMFYNENEDGEYVRINETFNEIIKEIKEYLARYKLRINYIGRDIVPYQDIPEEDFTEHYYISSYHDIKPKEEW